MCTQSAPFPRTERSPPVSGGSRYPRLLLLMTWADYVEEPLLRLEIDLVRNHNAVVTRQADVQWFRHPDQRMESSAAPWQPLSVRVHGAAYDPRTSLRREVVSRTVADMTEGAGEEIATECEYPLASIEARRAA